MCSKCCGDNDGGRSIKVDYNFLYKVTNYFGVRMKAKKTIALVAHDNRKKI